MMKDMIGIDKFLENSVYYPASGCDGIPIKYLGKRDIAPKCLVTKNPGLGFGCNFQQYPKLLTNTIKSSGKMPQYHFFEESCGKRYFFDLIKEYRVINEYYYRSPHAGIFSKEKCIFAELAEYEFTPKKK